MRTLIIGNKNFSSWSLRPWLLMRQFGLEFAEIMLPLDTPEFHRRIPDYSPTGRVPALHVDGEVLWDSLAICEVVNERWLEGRAWPTATAARAAARCAAAEMHSGFAALRTQLPMDCSRRPTERHWDEHAERDIARIEQLWRSLHASHGNDAGFLCGGFGIVDAMFAPVCVRFRGYGPSLAEDTQAYMHTILSLPAMDEWLAAAATEPPRAH